MRYDIGEIIALLRNEKRMTQKDLSAKSGLSMTALSEIECGKKIPRLPTLGRIAAALDMDLTQLLSYEPEESKDKEEVADKAEKKDDLDKNIIENISEEITAWLKTAESMPYIMFAYKLSKQVPVNLLGSLKFFIDINNGGAKS